MIYLVFAGTNVLPDGTVNHYFNAVLEAPFVQYYNMFNTSPNGNQITNNRLFYAVDSVYSLVYKHQPIGMPAEGVYVTNLLMWFEGANSSVTINYASDFLYLPDGPTYLYPSFVPRYLGQPLSGSVDIASRLPFVSGTKTNHCITGKINFFGVNQLYALTLYNGKAYRNISEIQSDPLTVGNCSSDAQGSSRVHKIFSYKENRSLSTPYSCVNGYILFPNISTCRMVNVSMPSGHFDLGNELPDAANIIHDPTIP